MRTVCAPRMHQDVSEREEAERGLEGHGSKKWRKALLGLNIARDRLAVVLQQNVSRERSDRQTRGRICLENRPFDKSAYKPVVRFLGLEAATFVFIYFATWMDG